MKDDETLFASVLIHSYALAESAAADHLSADARDFAGIEDWGERLLKVEGNDLERRKMGSLVLRGLQSS